MSGDMSMQAGGGSLVIRMDGAFDTESALEIARQLAALPEGAEVYVDLTHVRQFHDRGVAALGDLLASTRVRVSVRGLRQHQYRMLKYLGVPSSVLNPLSTGYPAPAD
ncbi:MAG TPA: STAS domain-containing protein [Anaeromyxobacteraceae bacterium]|nr:STAS domain-containing protein [Anaeromyxobacteraceae bacterium]